jgi:hypothetical protein
MQTTIQLVTAVRDLYGSDRKAAVAMGVTQAAWRPRRAGRGLGVERALCQTAEIPRGCTVTRAPRPRPGAALDFDVRYLNGYNRAVELARARFYRCDTAQGLDDFALNLTLGAVTDKRDELRQRVADACAPWFDASAFADAEADRRFGQPHYGHAA